VGAGGRLGVAVAFVAAFVAAIAPQALGAVPTTWCGDGSAAVSANRTPELVAGASVHVLYARASDATDRFAQVSDAIATDLATADAWWRREDPTRTVRFDLYGFPGCSGLAALDLSSVTLPSPGAAYADPLSGFGAIARDIGVAPFGFSHPFVAYVVYYDGPTTQPSICGVGGDSGGKPIAIMYIRACSLTLGTGRGFAHTAAHELIHAFGMHGGVPHECPPPHDGHVCDARNDIMYWGTDDSPLDNWFLDVGRDDYYGFGGSSVNIRNSPFLSHLDTPQVPLTLNVAGTGAADVESDVPGVSCTATCTVNWDGGSSFRLEELAGAHTRFVGWSGSCAGGDAVCALTMNGAKSVTATFAAQVSLSVQVNAQTGSGDVVSDPESIACPVTCSAEFDQGSEVRLHARPGRGSKLESWGGACDGDGDCVVRLDAAAKDVTATFVRATHVLRASVVGKGRVASLPNGISCPRSCLATFDAGRAVRLRATPSRGYRFVAWGGACRGRGTCTLSLEADASVRATFRKR
jgi:Divergent InlB B-repeat domain